MVERIAVVGLGYVGLPVAVGFAGKFASVVGFDTDEAKVAELRAGRDRTDSHSAEELRANNIRFTSCPEDMRGSTFFIVAVPTPVDEINHPDLSPLIRASETIGSVLERGSVVVYESTVYPGVTEDVCGPAIERSSGLKRGADFKLGYSPERINPGDAVHTFRSIVKIVSAEDSDSLERVATAYESVVDAGVHRAPTIKVAEAAKVIENTQRDLNIALMNELALIFDRMGIRTTDVLDAAGTKWNFLKFSPGLVGGHCIGVDPYYLSTKATQLGYHPQLILAARRLNDGMGTLLAQRLVKILAGTCDKSVGHARIGILGITFKEDVPDLRNSRVADIVDELKRFGADPLVHDPNAHPDEVMREYGLRLSPLESFADLDAVVLAVGHRQYLDMGAAGICALLAPGGALMDVKSRFNPSEVPPGIHYWCL